MSATAPAKTQEETDSEARRAELLTMEINDVAADYRRLYPAKSVTASHFYFMLACASIRQWRFENIQLKLIGSVEISDPALARVERYRAAAERSFHRALNALQELLQDEAKAEPAAPEQNNKTNPIRPTMDELRAKHPGMDRNQLARMRANMPAQT